MKQELELKETSSLWFKEVPQSWVKTKNKFIFNENKEIVGDRWEEFTLLTMGKKGVRVRNIDDGGKFPESFIGYKKVKPDDLIFCLYDIDETPRTVGISKDYGMITSSYKILSTDEQNNPHYWNYFYTSIDNVKGLKPYYTGLRNVVRTENFNNLNVYSPPIEEQNQIVSYLDKKTHLTDELIKKIEQKIELLKEQKNSLINEVVTQGLNPNVEMKNSGIEWIGEIPSHWDVMKLKYLSRITPSSVDKHIFDDEIQVSVCNYTHVYYNNFINTKVSLDVGSCKENEFSKFKLYKDDVIITKDSESPDDIGIPTLVSESLENTVCGYHLTIIRPEGIKGGYLFRFILSERTRRYFEINSNGVTRFGLGKPSVENLVIPLPSEEEQEQIITYLDRETQIIDDFISTEQKLIDLLKEYKQSLISDVVTGKKRVVS